MGDGFYWFTDIKKGAKIMPLFKNIENKLKFSASNYGDPGKYHI